VTETTETPGQAEAGQPEPPAAGQGINLEPVKKKLPPLPFELLSLEKGEGAEVKVKVRVTAEDFEFRMDDTLKDLRRKVAVDGFRRGNTPMRIIRRLYGKEAREDVVDKARESIVERVAGEKGLKSLAALIRTCFDLGGVELQFNTTDRKVLEEAIKTPARYEDLVVRVSGFSANFVWLDPAIQKDILARTEHHLG